MLVKGAIDVLRVVLFDGDLSTMLSVLSGSSIGHLN